MNSPYHGVILNPSTKDYVQPADPNRVTSPFNRAQDGVTEYMNEDEFAAQLVCGDSPDSWSVKVVLQGLLTDLHFDEEGAGLHLLRVRGLDEAANRSIVVERESEGEEDNSEHDNADGEDHGEDHGEEYSIV